MSKKRKPKHRRKRNPQWDGIRRQWETTEMTYRELEEMFGVKANTIRSRRNREKWSRDTAKRDVMNPIRRPEEIAREEEEIEEFRGEDVEKDINPNKLSEPRRLFCLYYMKYFNATKAYQKAYGCAYRTALNGGYRLLNTKEVREELDRLRKIHTTELMLDARMVLQKYIDIAFADITDFVEFGQNEIEEINESGEVVTRGRNYVNFKSSDMVDGTLISEIKQGREGASIKLADRMKALDILTKYFDLLSDKDQQRLQQEKLKLEIEKMKTGLEDGGDNQNTFIITGEEEMRRYLNERNS